MANYLVMFSAPEEHIQFMLKHPGTVDDYYVGEPPEQDPPQTKKRSFLDKLLGRKNEESVPASIDVPEHWPDEEQIGVDIEINHRNVELYHWILNQTSEPTTGSGSIFQTWFADAPDALPLEEDGENFAFLADKLPDLLTLVQAITPESASKAFQGWLSQEQGKAQTLDLESGTEFYREFQNFEKYLESAISKKHGLVWVMS